MTARKFATLLITGAAALTLAGCDEYGYGPSYGWGSGYYGDYYGGSRYHGSYPSYGWYDDSYYPGSGVYIYDRSGYRRTWDDRQRSYWEGRRYRRY